MALLSIVEAPTVDLFGPAGGGCGAQRREVDGINRDIEPRPSCSGIEGHKRSTFEISTERYVHVHTHFEL